MGAEFREILLVEDDPGDALLVEAALLDGREDRRVVRAGDGIEALCWLRGPGARRPHLILLDLNMPGMDGRDLLGVLKADPHLCTIPVVIVSGSQAPGNVVASYRGHASAYIVKPADLDGFTHAAQSIAAFFLDVVTNAAGLDLRRYP